MHVDTIGKATEISMMAKSLFVLISHLHFLFNVRFLLRNLLEFCKLVSMSKALNYILDGQNMIFRYLAAAKIFFNIR